MSLMFPRVRRTGFQRRFLRSRIKRRFRWQGFSVGTGPLNQNAKTRLPIIGAATFKEVSSRPTILRIRGEVLATLQAPAPIASPLQGQLYIGIGLQNANALAEFEDPFTHSFTDDWMWWQPIYLAASADARLSTLGSARFILDVRSKRRVDLTDDLVVVAVAAPSTNPTPVSAVVSGRALIGA